MLEIRNLTKVYRPKTGVAVTALDGISLSFPEKGMVFLVGKSGCGKSTLLNLLGGLDSYDSGEILISNESSRKFSQSRFDSYRNTLVGFIFQEYNVLEEFTVGANIALSLELQGKKASDETIAQILHRVDLDGYGNRRPNELSGGQKQRVAIARALVKDPKIIMADEPTGALDSNTGRQVLETLKLLSREKLVIVVSHDQEFAEQYADRIICLSDGKVVSDQEFSRDTCAFETGGISFGDHEIRLSSDYRLTEEDRRQINEYLEAMESGIQTKITVETKIRKGRDTVQPQHSHLSPIQFIRSRLPMKAAFRIGGGALKYKKIRLVFTILLSCVAFGLFGLADTFGAYDHIATCTRSILDSEIGYASFVRAEQYEYEDEDLNQGFYYSESGRITKEELLQISEESGVKVEGVFVPYEADLSFMHLYNEKAEFTQTDFHIYPYQFNGFAEIHEQTLQEQGMTLLAGRFPEGDRDEIVISSYICETFYIGGFAKEEGGKTVYEPIKTPEDMLGKVFSMHGTDYTVVGVVSSGFDLERYRDLTKEKKGESTAEELLSYALMQELYGIRDYSLAQVILVGEGYLDGLLEKEPGFRAMDKGYVSMFYEKTEEAHGEKYDERYYFDSAYYGTISDAKGYEIVWLDGKERDSLSEKEVVISSGIIGASLPQPNTEENLYDEEGRMTLSALSSEEKRNLLGYLCELKVSSEVYRYHGRGSSEYEDMRIVGVLLPDETGKKADPGSVILASETLLEGVLEDRGGLFQYAVGAMPRDYGKVEKLVSFSNREDVPVRFELQNSVVFELESIHELLLVLSRIFLYVGIGFAVFAAVLLGNFIGTSVAYKKQEIGILRAIGARSNDVFRIFFAESFVIAMINFILSALGTFAAVTLINYFIRTETGILVTILGFSWRQGVLLFAVSLLVAAVGSFLPVKKIAAKKPIDAIRGR